MSETATTAKSPAAASKNRRKSVSTSSAGPSTAVEDSQLPESPRSSKKRKRTEAPAPTVSAEDDLPDNTTSAAPSGEPMTTEETATAEELVLSHAAARKERKKAEKVAKRSSKPGASASASADEGESGEKKKKIKSGDKGKETPAAPKRQNSIWVGNLSFKTTVSQIEQFFQFAGTVTRIHLPMKGDAGKQVNRGFAYVDFATPEAKTEAITYSERNLEGRRLLIKDGGDYTGRPIPAAIDPTIAAAATPADGPAPGAPGPTTSLSHFAQKVLKRQKQPPAPTLFMGNLGFEATADSIRAMIEAHEKVRDAKALARKKNAAKAKPKVARAHDDGSSDDEDSDKENDEDEEMEERKEASLVKVRVGTFEDSGNCKGFAFLDFRSPQLATAALTDPRNYSMDGRELKLEFAGADAVRRSGLHPKPALDAGKHAAGGGRGHGKQGPRGARHAERAAAAADSATQEPGEGEPQAKRAKLANAKEGAGKHHRLRPGAALAGAPREQPAIVPSEGKKIVF